MQHHYWVDLIFKEREWSWSLIGLLSFLVALVIRALFLRGVLGSMKVRNKSWYKRTLDHYQRRSFVGWIFFSLPILGMVLIWTKGSIFLKYFNLFEWFLIFSLLFLLSVLFHLRAYAYSIVEALQENVAMDKEL